MWLSSRVGVDAQATRGVFGSTGPPGMQKRETVGVHEDTSKSSWKVELKDAKKFEIHACFFLYNVHFP